MRGLFEEAEIQSANGPMAHATISKKKRKKKKEKRKGAHLRGVGEEAESQSADGPIAPSFDKKAARFIQRGNERAVLGGAEEGKLKHFKVVVKKSAIPMSCNARTYQRMRP
jgi:hypothetical protein